MRHLERLSIFEHRLRTIDNIHPKSWQSYVSHPPLVVFTSLFFNQIFQPPEFAIRFGGVLASTGITFLLFLVIRRHFSQRAALFSTFFSSIVPLSSYYGGTAFVHDLAFLVFATLLLWCLTCLKLNLKTLLLLPLITLLGTFSDVHFNYFPFVTAFVFLLFFREKITLCTPLLLLFLPSLRLVCGFFISIGPMGVGKPLFMQDNGELATTYLLNRIFIKQLVEIFATPSQFLVYFR